jgi:foldase protein PrsA
VRNVKNLVITALIGIFALSATGCAMIEKTPQAIKGAVVAQVGDVKITKGQLDERLTGVINELKKEYGANYMKNEEAKAAFQNQAKQALEMLVTEQVFLQKAVELKLVPDEATLTEEANKELAETKKLRFGDDEAKFDEAVAYMGLTKDTVLSYFKSIVVIDKVYEKILNEVEVTDKDISDYYETNKKLFTTGPGAEMYHILAITKDRNTGEVKRTEAEAEAVAKEIKAKLDAGEKFEDLAKQYGEDGTKDRGGSLGFVEYDEQGMDADFMAAAKVLKENEVSGPVKTQFGYHIIKVTDIQTESKVTPLDEVKDGIKGQLLNKKQKEHYDATVENWKKDLNVKTFEKNI